MSRRHVIQLIELESVVRVGTYLLFIQEKIIEKVISGIVDFETETLKKPKKFKNR